MPFLYNELNMSQLTFFEINYFKHENMNNNIIEFIKL